MNCAECERMISRFVDLEVKATGNGDLFEHLGKCAECRQWLDTLLRMNVEYEKIRLTFESENESNIRPKIKMMDKLPIHQGLIQTQSTRARTAAFLMALMLIIGIAWSATLPKQEDYRLDLTKASPQTEFLFQKR
jgi:predicted anti-sigma-YlaC factor YlaD